MKGVEQYDSIHNFTNGVGRGGNDCVNNYWCGWRCNVARLWRCHRICTDHHVDRKTFQEKGEVSPVTRTPLFLGQNGIEGRVKNTVYYEKKRF